MPSPRNVHLDSALSRLTVKLGQAPGGFVADQIAPAVPVSKKSDKYRIYSVEHMTDDTSPLRGPKGTPREVDYTLSQDSYYCDELELFHFVPDSVERNADAPLQPEADGVALLVEKQRLYLDKLVKTKIETLKTTSGAYTTPSIKWNASGAKILQDIYKAKDSFRKRCGRDPNTIMFCADVWVYALSDSDVKDIVKRFDPQRLLNGEFPPQIGGMRVVIPGALEQTANLGDITAPFTSASISDIWSNDDVYLMYVNPAPGVRSMAFVNQFVWVPWYTRTARDEHRGGGGTNIYTGTARDVKVVADRAGYVLKDVLA